MLHQAFNVTITEAGICHEYSAIQKYFHANSSTIKDRYPSTIYKYPKAIIFKVSDSKQMKNNSQNGKYSDESYNFDVVCQQKIQHSALFHMCTG